jgi:hypothetical protein
MPARRGQVKEDRLIGPAALKKRDVVGDLKPVGYPDCLGQHQGAAPKIVEAWVCAEETHETNV